MDRVTREISLPAPPAAVWRAITEDLSSWFGADAEVEAWRPGARIAFTFPDGLRRAAVIERLEPDAELSFRWLGFARLSDGSPMMLPPTHVEITLEPRADGTIVRVVEAGFPAARVSA